ncbi:MAG: SUMF1/EgtB/PvdO family nonheme iron enzyme, partial [Lentisphaeria bacterium]|nr:SUMF1/EgtB/PvdO family nonheme iron enzyme [Lentisphaeria bacterium]
YCSADGSCTVCALPNAVNGCHDLGAGRECYVISCLPGWENPDGDDEPSDILGCEYECTKSGPEECDGLDNDCDTLTDEPGEYPDGISPPTGMVCSNQGECDGPTPVCSECDGVTTWRCDYRASPGAVEVDSCGELVPEETLCDGLDNDCDLQFDESFPQVAHTPTDEGDPCDDGENGICRGTGNLICDPTDPSAVMCDITEPGQTALSYELCNNLDDNCNGLVDEVFDPLGVIVMSDTWVQVGSGITSSGVWVGSFRIDAYEASRPDADAINVGSADHLACSNPGTMPWRSVTRPEASAACLAAGKRLCTEDEWQRACEGDGPFGASYTSYPYGVAYDLYACNGWDYDFDCTVPNDHFVLYPTGNDYGCPLATDTCLSEFGVYDLSGNLQEWTSTLLSSGPDHYGVRGGTYESPPGELTCQSASIAFNDAIRLPSLGFRCCQDLL